MSKLRIEIQITVLAVIIGIVVVTMGYFSYESLSKIVNYIQQGTHHDDKIFIIKGIDSDLNALENTVRLYALTNDYEGLEDFYSHEDKISQRLKELAKQEKNDPYDVMLIDSISKLTSEKMELWNEILKIHLSKKGIFPAFSKFYSKLEVKKSDTIPVDTQNIMSSTGVPDSLNLGSNTAVSKTSIERRDIKKEIQKLEWEIYKSSTKKNVLESQLIEQNVMVSGKITQLITEAESRDTRNFMEKTAKADQLAEISYKRLALFTGSTVLLLLVSIFVLFNYLRKARSAQRTLADAGKKAEALAHAKEQFAANVSHELRTPVNAIYGLTEQLLQKKLDDKTTEMVSVIFKSAGHLKNLVNETLDFTKLQSANIVLEKVHFSPVEIIDEVYSLVINEASKKGIALRFDWEGEKPETLIGDPLRLKQIIINLIGNSIKFTEKGEVTAKVKGVPKGNKNIELEIQVIDTGIGIEKEKMDAVFEEYVQIESASGRKYSGTGLGLSIAKKLVELQMGTIKLESIRGVGTKVTISILYPLGDPAKVEKVVSEMPQIPDSFRQLSVLIADDEEYNRFLLKNILHKWGVRFKEATNGNEVIKIACTEHFDIILMDINMPEINGFQAAKAIVQCDTDVIIIAVTAATEKLDREACFESGMKGFLFKPYAEKDLFTSINTALLEERNKNRAKQSKQIADINELRRIAGNDDIFLSEMVLLFIKSMEAGVTGIETALRNEKRDDISENAHKMAAPVKHIGANHLYENIKILEKITKQTVDFTTIGSVFQEIKNEIEELNAQLTKVLQEIKT